MAALDFANYDFDAMAEEACGPNATWDGSQCVPNAPPPKPAILGPGGEQLRVDRFGRAQGMGTGFDPHDLGGGLSDAAYYPGFDDATSAPIPPWTGGEAAKTLLGASAFTGEADLDELIRSVNLQSSYDILNDPNWAGNRPTMNQPILNTSTGEMISGKDAIAQLQDPLWKGNWSDEEWAAGQAFLASLGTPATTAAPATTGAATTTPAAVPGIDAAEQAWLDAAIAGGTFTGDLGQVPAEQVLGNVGGADLGGATLDDPRIQMRIDLAESLLQQGHTVADIEQFLGVVGDQEWFEGFAADEDYMADEGRAAGVTDALARIEATGTATLPWVDSPEFAAAFGSPDGSSSADDTTVTDDGTVTDDTIVTDDGTSDGVPAGVPAFVSTQIDEINILNARLKTITDAHKKLQDSGLGEIDAIEEALTDAESEIFAAQYGVRDPITGELLTPGEMDRLRSTFDNRRTTSKKNRIADRDEIVQIMISEGTDPALAQSELDMIQAIHGDSVDTQFDFIDAMWRIGKMSHDERTSMITNMMASYRLQLRDTVVEMLMAEEVTTAEDVAGAQQDALRSDTIANLYGDMSEDEVYALMRSDLLKAPEAAETGLITEGAWAGYTRGEQANVYTSKGYEYSVDTDTWTLPEDDPITGLIESGEWAGYTQGEKAAKLTGLGWTYGADGVWKPPVEDAATADGDAIINTMLPDGITPFTGTADEYWAQTGEYPFAAAEEEVEEITKDLPDGTAFTGTVAEYVARSGVYPFAAAAEQDDPKKFTVSVDRINELDPTGGWLQGQVDAGNLTIIGARPDRREAEGASGFVTMDWEDWIFTEEPYEAAFESITMDLPDGTPFTGTAQEYYERSGEYPFAAPEEAEVEEEVRKYRMNASELTDRGISLTDFEVFGGGVPGSTSQVMIGVEEWADLTGEYMFPAAAEADPSWMTDVFPSGVMVADVPGLTSFDTTPDGTEYLMDIEAVGVFEGLQGAIDARRAASQQKNIEDIVLESPSTGIYGMIAETVGTLKTQTMADTGEKWGDLTDDTTMWLVVIERASSSDEGYAQIWANYTGNNVTVDKIFHEPSQGMRGRIPVITVEPDPDYKR